MPYVGREANSFTTVVDVTVSDDLTVTDDATIGGNLSVSGATTITTADNTTQLSLISTDADANVGPRLVLQRNSSSPADGDNTGKIEFTSNNDADEATIFTTIRSEIDDASNGSEDGQVKFDMIVAGAQKTILRFKKDEVVINDDSIDLDFRVESNGEANMLFVDGGNDRVVMSKSSAGATTFPLVLTNPSGNSANTASGLRFVPTNATIGDRTVDIVASQTSAGGNAMELKFLVSNGGTAVERMRVTSTAGANLRVSDGINLLDGNLVVASGHGIDFSATSGSPTSELFDDYEEGTFTPGLKDALNGNAAGAGATSGRYTKIGRVVNFSFAIQVNSLSGMTAGNVLNVTDLPYVVNNDSAGGAEPHAQILSFINNLDSADYAGSIVLRPNNNTTSCELKYTAGGAVTSQGFTSLLVQDIAANTFLTGAATYETT